MFPPKKESGSGQEPAQCDLPDNGHLHSNQTAASNQAKPAPPTALDLARQIRAGQIATMLRAGRMSDNEGWLAMDEMIEEARP